MIAAYEQRRNSFVQGLRDIGLPCHLPEGAFYVFPSITGTGLTSEQFAIELMQEMGVGVVPGTVFGEGGAGFIRCSYSVAPEQLDKALERMERFVRKQSAYTIDAV